jgi:hypothetical protein
MAATDRFDVPPEMRLLLRKALNKRDRPSTVHLRAHTPSMTLEGQAETARQGAKDVTERR